jgi:hypothetical protein
MRKNIFFIIGALTIIAFFLFLVLEIGNLQNKITILESNRNVEVVHVIDSIKSAEFEALQRELKIKDSTYNEQIKILQNENQRLKTNYNRLYNSYSNIIIDRPRW